MIGDVLLRDVTEGDLPIFFEQQQDPAANRMAAFTAKDPADRAAFAAKWAKILGDESSTNRTILFGGQVAGSIGAFVAPWSGKLEVTYWLGREFWGKGIATNALALFLSAIQARPLYARAAKDNIASLRVLEKCGFTITGYERGFANARGEEVEEVVLELRAEAREGSAKNADPIAAADGGGM
jgi:RimJ/RimL family protein N-acetyltransferase